MKDSDHLSPKEESLAGIAASIAAGCRPCTRRWLQGARASGACERSIRLAIETGLSVRAAATHEMADFADAQQGSIPELDEGFRAERTRLVEILSCGAALAAESSVHVERHIDNARGLGATTAQISAAVAIGRAAAKMATEQAEKVVARSDLDPSPTLAGNWCCDELKAGMVPAQQGCGCGGSRS